MGFNTLFANWITEWIKSEDDEDLTKILEDHDEWKSYAEGDLSEFNSINTKPLIAKKEEEKPDSDDDDFGNFNSGDMQSLLRNFKQG